MFERCQHRCHKCRRTIRPAEAWTCEHLTAMINGGENRERNLDVTCSWCLPIKNAADVGEKKIVYRKRLKHRDLRKAKCPFPGSRASGLKKCMNGDVVKR